MSDVKARVAQLEQVAGGNDHDLVVVCWGNPDGTVTVDGERMTTEEHRQRCLEAGGTYVPLTWGDE